MTIAIRQPMDAGTLIQASQDARAMLGYAPPVLNRARRVSDKGRPTVITPGCMGGRKWRMSEIDKMRSMAGTIDPVDIAAALGRSRDAVMQKACLEGFSLRVWRSRRAPLKADPERSQAIFARCTPAMRKAIRDTSESTGFSVEDILGWARPPALARARRIMIWTIVRDTKMSLSGIARKLERDHSSIHHAVRRHNDETGENLRGMGGVLPGKKEAQARYFAKRRAA